MNPYGMNQQNEQIPKKQGGLFSLNLGQNVIEILNIIQSNTIQYDILINRMDHFYQKM